VGFSSWTWFLDVGWLAGRGFLDGGWLAGRGFWTLAGWLDVGFGLWLAGWTWFR